MEVVVLILILAVIAIYFLVLRRPKKEQPKPLGTRKPFAAVRVKPHEHACNAAFDMSHRTFLVSDAPILPLQDCNKSESCRCGYRHYDDRRQGISRRGESIVMTDAYAKKERRDDKHGRRKDD